MSRLPSSITLSEGNAAPYANFSRIHSVVEGLSTVDDLLSEAAKKIYKGWMPYGFSLVDTDKQPKDWFQFLVNERLYYQRILLKPKDRLTVLPKLMSEQRVFDRLKREWNIKFDPEESRWSCGTYRWDAAVPITTVEQDIKSLAKSYVDQGQISSLRGLLSIEERL